MSINYQLLVESYKKFGADVMNAELAKQIKDKTIDCKNFDFGNLWEATYGIGTLRRCRAGDSANEVMEAAGFTSTASFKGISGQIIYGLTLDAYQSPEFIYTRAIPEYQSNFTFEKVAGITDLGDQATVVGEGQPYPVAGPSETYINLPETQKRGFIVQLTREAIFFDRTNVLQDRCANGGKSMGQNREKRAVNCIIDENGGAVSAAVGGHRYHWRGTSIATYGDSSGSHSWDNLSASTALSDWASIDTANQLLAAMTDPDTGEPIVFTGKHLVCGLQKQMTATRIVNATQIVMHVGGYPTSGNLSDTYSPSPLPVIQVLSSPYYDLQAATDTTWFWGDLGAAFVYVQNWAPEVKNLGGGTQLEFNQDVVQQYRFSEYGAFGTKEPRAIVKATA